MTDKNKNKGMITDYLDFEPTGEQVDVLNKIANFLDAKDQNTFILKGAAGTGKTSILKSVVGYLSSNDMSNALLAPTGRAASIISAKTGYIASTIHSHLYRVNEVKDDDGNILYIEFIKRQNHTAKPVIYLIDEASMVGDEINKQDYFVSKKPLLEDLVNFIQEGHDDNKIIFVGDPYQLPPINSNFSPALSEEYLENAYNLKTETFELTEVKRQDENSYILGNASNLRQGIIQRSFNNGVQFENPGNEDMTIIQYRDALRNGDANNSIFLGWKNVSVNYLNNRMREMLYQTQDPIVPGERIILNQSHYGNQYLPAGTFLIVEKLLGPVEVLADFRFVTVKLCMPDSDEVLPGEYKIEIDSLVSENGYSDGSKMKKLWHERFRTNELLRETKDRRSDEYLSALKVRYAYAITTHKAQGGEWDNVYLFPEIPFGPNGMRWLYTSVTRARKHLFSFK